MIRSIALLRIRHWRNTTARVVEPGNPSTNTLSISAALAMCFPAGSESDFFSNSRDTASSEHRWLGGPLGRAPRQEKVRRLTFDLQTGQIYGSGAPRMSASDGTDRLI